MVVKQRLGALGPLVAALAWGLALTVDSAPYDSSSTLLLVSGLLVSATVSVIGLVVVGGRWAYRLAWVVLGLSAVVATIRPLDGFWWLALGVSIAAAIGLFPVSKTIRKLPSATGPGERAVLVPLGLLQVPTLVGLLGVGPSFYALAIGLSALVAAFLYSRVIFTGLVAVRVGWPLLATVLSLFLEMPSGLIVTAAAIAVAGLAWHPSVKAAFHPPREVGSTFPIPPELAPTEILDAAGIDDRGRRQ